MFSLQAYLQKKLIVYRSLFCFVPKFFFKIKIILSAIFTFVHCEYTVEFIRKGENYTNKETNKINLKIQLFGANTVLYI